MLFSSTPSDYAEQTHLNVQPPEYWAGLFARASFYRDVDLEATFVAPHAVVFRRHRGSMVPIVRGYERRIWRLASEVRALRDAQQSTGADIGPHPEGEGVSADQIPIDHQHGVAAFYRADRRAAASDTATTRRGRMVHRGLKCLADGLDWAYTRVAARRANPPAAQLDGAAGPDGAQVEIGIDGPLPNPLCRRLALVSGWSIDRASLSGPGISAVRVHLDGVCKGTATGGLPRSTWKRRRRAVLSRRLAVRAGRAGRPGPARICSR